MSINQFEESRPLKFLRNADTVNVLSRNKWFTRCGKIGHQPGFCGVRLKISLLTVNRIKKFSVAKPQHLQVNGVKRKFVDLTLNMQNLTFQIDCRSNIALLFRFDWQKLGQPKLWKANVMPISVSNNMVRLTLSGPINRYKPPCMLLKRNQLYLANGTHASGELRECFSIRSADKYSKPLLSLKPKRPVLEYATEVTRRKCQYAKRKQ